MTGVEEHTLQLTWRSCAGFETVGCQTISGLQYSYQAPACEAASGTAIARSSTQGLGFEMLGFFARLSSAFLISKDRCS